MNRENKAMRHSKVHHCAVQLAALRADSELQMRDLIRRRLAMPMEKRTNFLRRRLPGGGSCL